MVLTSRHDDRNTTLSWAHHTAEPLTVCVGQMILEHRYVDVVTDGLSQMPPARGLVSVKTWEPGALQDEFVGVKQGVSLLRNSQVVRSETVHLRTWSFSGCATVHTGACRFGHHF